MTLDDLTDVTVGDGPLDLDLPKTGSNMQQSSPRTGMDMYSPFAVRPNQTWDDRTMDRMVTIKKPKQITEGMLWITDGDFAETLSLFHLNRIEQREFWKKFRRIQMMSGELSKRIMATRQERLMMELISQKSRIDVVEGGNICERDGWVTTVQHADQTMHYPPQADRKKSWFGSVFGR